MARRTNEPPPSVKLTDEQKRTAITRLRRRAEELKKLDVSTINRGSDPPVAALEKSIESTVADIFGPGTHQYRQLQPAMHFDDTTYVMSVMGHGGTTAHDIRQGVDRGRHRAAALLDQAAASLEEELEFADDSANSDVVTPKSAPQGIEVFVVHGRDEAAKDKVQLFLERAGLKAIVLHQQPNAGRTIIEKFEDHGGAVRFAVVLLTPDDVGGIARGPMEPRARQNVIAEMGWFAGKLGRSRVCVLKKGDVAVPSDFAGVAYTEMDDRGAWKQELLRELATAGYTVEWGKALA